MIDVPRYYIFNNKITVLKSTKRRFSKLGMLKITSMGSELKPIDRIVVKKYICIY